MASEKEPGGELPAADKRLSIWERLEHPTPAPRASLTHDQIAAAAVEIADTEGLDCVSIRRLAGRLGVAPMALYRYVSSKEEIFELMVDAVHAGGVDFGATSGDWRAVMRATAHGSRATMLRHPWLGRVSSQVVTALTPSQLASAERALAALDGLDLDADTMMAIFDTVIAYARGATAREVVLLENMKREGWQTGDDVRDALAPHMIWHMRTGRYPTFQQWAREAKRKDDVEWRFDFGLDCVLNGIAAQLSI